MSQFLNTFLYFFQPVPSDAFQYHTLYIVMAVGVLLASIGMRIVLSKKKNDKIFKKYFRTLPFKLQSIGICLVIYILARYGKIPFVSMRLVSYIIFGTLAYIVVQNIRIYMNEYPAMQKRHEEQMKKNKYIPGKKK